MQAGASELSSLGKLGLPCDVEQVRSARLAVTASLKVSDRCVSWLA